jgi:hypothetical protein
MIRYKTEIKWGVIFMAVMLAWMVFEKIMGWHGPRIDRHAVMTNMFSVLAITVYAFALRDKRTKDLNGRMTWKQGFTAGAVMTGVVVLLSPIGQLITHLVISPEYFPNVIEYSVSQELLTRADAEAYFNLRSYMTQSVIGALLMGLLTTAVVVVFLRTKETAPAEPDEGS